MAEGTLQVVSVTAELAAVLLLVFLLLASSGRLHLDRDPRSPRRPRAGCGDCPGLMLATPLTVCIKIVCRNFPDLHWIAALLDQRGAEGEPALRGRRAIRSAQPRALG